MPESPRSGPALGGAVQPRYTVLARSLAAEISAGILAVGDRLPGERELCRTFDVSRVTVRRALEVLRDEGLIESVGARGWFVTPATLGEPSVLRSFTDMAQARGLEASARTLKQVVRPVTLDEADTFGVSPAAEIFELERLRLLNGAPVGLEGTRIRIDLAPSIARGRYEDRSLYRALRTAGLVPTKADYDLQSVQATVEQGALLECAPGWPLLLALAATYDQRGRLIELSRSVFRGDRYRFRTTLFSSGIPRRAASLEEGGHRSEQRR